ncbi:MAG: class I SAM-dependent methyltransferase, partial [Gemmatimonadota bacterium]|nr:class I SAM-dependent methyltransferase [Gemmatimonadota bacterium]
MRRLNLPELEDQPWFPAWLRDAMTGYLQVIIEMARPYDVAAPVLASLLEASPTTDVVDLASGAGGPWRQLMSVLRAQGLSPRVTLTDLSPNQTSAAQLKGEEGLAYHLSSVSAADIPEDLGGVRTMFTALHHFSPDEVRDILRSAQRERVAFAGFEATQRS